jgi:hypothetical protein
MVSLRRRTLRLSRYDRATKGDFDASHSQAQAEHRRQRCDHCADLLGRLWQFPVERRSTFGLDRCDERTDDQRLRHNAGRKHSGCAKHVSLGSRNSARIDDGTRYLGQAYSDPEALHVRRQ